MAQRFKAKTLLSNSGVFNNEVIAPNLVYNTGNQTISGTKTFDVAPILGGNQLITGNLSLYATNANLISTGSQIDILSGQVVFKTGNQTISGQKWFVYDDPTITQYTYNHNYANLVIAEGYGPSVPKFKALTEYRPYNYGQPSYYYSGIGSTTGEVQIYFDTGDSRWKYYYGGLSAAFFIAKSPVVTPGGFEADFPLKGWTDNLNQIVDIKFSAQITHNESHASGQRDALDPNSIGAVALTGNQSIFGIKSFATGIDIINSGNPQRLRVFNRTGLNTGEFGFFGWNNNQLTIGSQQTNSGILRDVTLTGANININASGVFNIFDTTNISGNLNVTGNIFLSGNSVLTGSNHTHLWSQSTYDAQIGTSNGGFAGRTSVGTLTLHAGSQNTAVPSFYGWDGFTNTSFTAATARTNLELTSTATAVENTFVRTTGNQSISGNKTFLGNLVINNLTVTGTESIVNTSNVNIGSNFLLLNVTGGGGVHGPASDGGIFFITGSGLTGINDTGAILGYDSPTNKWVFGLSTRNSDLALLNEIASVSLVTSLSGRAVFTSGNQTISGNKTLNDSIFLNSGLVFLRLGGGNEDVDIDLLSRPFSNTRVSIGTETGLLGQSINTSNFEREIKIWETGGFGGFYGPFVRIGRSGVLISEKTESKVGIGTLFPTEKVHISGGNLKIEGNAIANNLVYNTGNQTISGDKSFVNGISFSQNHKIYLDGDNSLIISGSDNTPEGMKFVLANNTNVTSITFDPDDHGLVFRGDSYYFLNQRPQILNTGDLSLRGMALSDEVVSLTGNQTISGVKTFTSGVIMSGNLQVSGTGIFNAIDLNNIDNLSLSGVDITITSGLVVLTNPVSAPNIVYNTGNQTISGVKTFANNIIYPVSSGVTGIIFTPDASTSTFFDYTLTGNSTLNQPINMNNGQSITLFLTQDASGNRNMSFDSGYLFSNGINPTLNLVPSGTDIMQVIKTRNKLYCTFASNY